MKIIVTIPTYNEADNITNTIKTVFLATKRDNYELEVLIIDDSSPDGTADIVQELASKNKDINLLIRKEKKGLGAAYAEGWDYAFTELQADAVITFDADLSHDPYKIDEMISEYQKGVDIVIGTRYANGGGIPEEWGIHRKFLSKFGNLFVRLLYFNSGISDFTSGYKLISKKVYNKIKDRIEKHGGYTFSISTNIEPIRAGFKPTEVSYKFTDRQYGKSKMGMEYMINALIFVIRLRIEDILNIRFIKVAVAGGAGAVVQLLTFGLIFEPLIVTNNIFGMEEIVYIELINRTIEFHPQIFLSTFLSIELGVIVAFFVNNKWAFKENKLSGIVFITRFFKNHIVILGAIIIQLLIIQLLSSLFGTASYLLYIYQIIGILAGLVWNYYFYKKIIWKVKNIS